MMARIALAVRGRLTMSDPNYLNALVPSMAEIEALPWCGLNVVSTFSGAGGSCLGYRMAGMRVLWASEFIPAAAEVYKLNYPNSHLDTRDIRKVDPDDILQTIGLGQGEIDVLDGSPPCASFSSSGKRSDGWGDVKTYSDTTQRVDDLFWEYGRILKGLMPKAFVAENVTGLVRGVAKGYFLEILQMLKDSGYKVEARVLDASWLGVPQARKRLIFVGFRNDLGLDPVHPKAMSKQTVMKDVMSMSSVSGACGQTLTDCGLCSGSTSMVGYALEPEWRRLRIGQGSNKYLNLVRPDPDRPCPTITQLGGRNPGTASVTHPIQCRKFTICELRRLCGFPDDFKLTGKYAKQWERLGRAVPPPMMAAIAGAVRAQLEVGAP